MKRIANIFLDVFIVVMLMFNGVMLIVLDNILMEDGYYHITIMGIMLISIGLYRAARSLLP